jgi:hypothetical protein
VQVAVAVFHGVNNHANPPCKLLRWLSTNSAIWGCTIPPLLQSLTISLMLFRRATSGSLTIGSPVHKYEEKQIEGNVQCLSGHRTIIFSSYNCNLLVLSFPGWLRCDVYSSKWIKLFGTEFDILLPLLLRIEDHLKWLRVLSCSCTFVLKMWGHAIQAEA